MIKETHGKTEKETEKSGDEGDGQADAQRLQFGRAGKEVEKVGEGEKEIAFRIFAREGVEQDEQHGDDDEQRQKHRIGDAELLA